MITKEIKLPWGLLEVVAKVLKMEVSDYQVKSNKVYYADLRRIGAMILKRAYPHMNLTEIGSMFGKDHSTVIHYITTGIGFLQIKQQPFLSKYVMCEQAADEWLATPNTDDIIERMELVSTQKLNYAKI